MIVKFKNPHHEVDAQAELIPYEICVVTRILDGLSKTIDFALGALAYVAPKGYWFSISLEDECLRLLHCDSDYPDEGIRAWKLIEFEEVT